MITHSLMKLANFPVRTDTICKKQTKKAQFNCFQGYFYYLSKERLAVPRAHTISESMYFKS